jgi:high-affinity iron transporter
MSSLISLRTAKIVSSVFLIAAALVVVSVFVWQGITASGNPDPTASHTSTSAAVINTGVLVFREGLECILVLSAVVASMMGANKHYRRPIAIGVAIGFVVTIITWFVAVGIIHDLSQNISALNVQAATGLLAIVVLLVVMNWFFHKIYWTGWISMHNRKKKELLKSANNPATSAAKVLWGLVLLGFASFYREGVEVVLFLQSFRMRLGNTVILEGVIIGLVLTGLVAILNFVAHRHLPYKKMLVVTGMMLGAVLLVMVGEQAQEMQLAHWITTTPIPSLQWIPGWMGLWFSVFPTVESLTAQAIAAILVIGSYVLARYQTVMAPRRRGEVPARRPESAPAEKVPVGV